MNQIETINVKTDGFKKVINTRVEFKIHEVQRKAFSYIVEKQRIQFKKKEFLYNIRTMGI